MRACVRICICASFTSAAAAAAAALIDFSYTFLLSRTAAEILSALTLPLALSHSPLSVFCSLRGGKQKYFYFSPSTKCTARKLFKD